MARRPRNQLTRTLADFVTWERVARVATAGSAGMPHVVPVCHVLVGGRIYFASGDDGRKVKNLREDARAMLHLEAGDDGEQLQVLQGTVELSAEPTVAWLDRLGEAYLAKYADGIAHLGWTPDRMWADYSTVVVFRPHKLNYELLGNQVPHLHWHLFPRHVGDADLLSPVWGALARAERDRAELHRLQTGPISREHTTDMLRRRLLELVRDESV